MPEANRSESILFELKAKLEGDGLTMCEATTLFGLDVSTIYRRLRTGRLTRDPVTRLIRCKEPPRFEQHISAKLLDSLLSSVEIATGELKTPPSQKDVMHLSHKTYDKCNTRAAGHSAPDSAPDSAPNSLAQTHTISVTISQPQKEMLSVCCTLLGLDPSYILKATVGHAIEALYGKVSPYIPVDKKPYN